MRPENVLAWSIGVEFGAPPPSQPPFDQFGNPVVDVAANVKEWKREFQAQQAERKTHERDSRQQNSNGPKIGSSKSEVEAYIKDWRGAGMRQEREGEERERIPRQQNLNTPKPGPPNPDAEARWNHMRREQADREERERMRRILFPNAVPKEAPKPEPKSYKIPQKKPVPKSSNDIPSRPPPPPQVVLLRNGETKKIENRASYAERVRELGYPEVLCPLPMKEIDCTGAIVVKQKDVRQDWEKDEELGRLGDRDGSHTPQNQLLTPEMLALSAQFLTLKPGQKRL